jgi:hypothetical protein
VKLFLSYQRADSRHVAGRLRDRLVQELGAENVFFDVDSISLGMDFRGVIRESIEAADAFIILIGNNWNSKKLTKADDYVRMEIMEALRQQKPIVPVLLDDQPMPSPASLPPDIRDLAYRNGARLRADPDFQADCTRLIRDLRELRDARPPSLIARPQGGASLLGVSRTDRTRLITVSVDGTVHTIDYRLKFMDVISPSTITLDGAVIYRKTNLPLHFDFFIGGNKARIEAEYRGMNKISRIRLLIDLGLVTSAL